MCYNISRKVEVRGLSIKAIVFDKDGTLVDYGNFWIPVSKCATEYIFESAGVPLSRVDAHLYDLGVRGDNVDIKSPLAKGDHKGIINLLLGEIKAVRPEATFSEAARLMIEGYGKDSKQKGKVLPTCDNMCDLLKSLRSLGIILALVTSDDISGAEICLEKLGVKELFDEIITAELDKPTKPDPYLMNRFMKKYGLSQSEVIMVGDTETDILFAKNSGVFSVGVGKSAESREYLSLIGASVTMRDISGVYELVRNFK